MVEQKTDHRAGRVAGVLRHALGKTYTVVPATKLPKGVLSAKKLREAGKAIGADLIVRVHVAGGGTFLVTVDATDGRGAVYKGKFKLAHGGLDHKTAMQIVQAVDASDKLVPVNGKPEPASEENETPLALVDPAETEAEVASPLEELSEDEDYVEPDTKVTYMPRDGRRGLVLTAGYAMLARNAVMQASDGIPPGYDGVLSPGFALNFSLFPRRFRDGGGAARDLGVYARGWVAFMPTQLVDASGGGPVSTSLSVTLHLGGVYRHSFGEDPKAVALGVELGLVWDYVRVAAGLPFPATNYISPAVNLLLEVPLAKKALVWVTRAGVMPVTGVGGTQINTFGAWGNAFGIFDATGLRSVLAGDMLYAEATGMITIYWQSYRGAGGAGFTNSYGRDLSVGFQLSLGVTY